MGSGDMSTTTPSPHCAFVQRHARRGRTGRPGRRTSTTTVAAVCVSLFMSLSRSLVVEADSTRRHGLAASKAPAPATVSSSPSSSDFVAVYYNLYKQQTSPAVSSISSPVVFKQSVPSEINDRLDRYSLQFADLPELLKRALLWESGYSIGDSTSLVQIHTLCGLSMAQIALSADEFKASACDTTSCTGPPAEWSYSKACRSDQLLPVAKCASTAIDTVSSTPLWSSKALPSNASEVRVVPNIQARRHKWPNQDASTPPAHVYAIHSALSDEEGQEISDVCKVSTTTTSTAMVIPCSPYIRTDTRWCRPAQSELMTTWLEEYTQKLQLDYDDLKTGNDTSAASSAANALMQGGTLDVESNVTVGTSELSKDAHSVYVSAGYKYDGSSSDFTQQFYRRYLASGDSNGGGESGAVDKLILHDSLPKEIEQRLSDASLQFDDLPALLQRALVWDSGYAFDESSSSLIAVYVKCGFAMSDIAVSRETSMGISSSSCTVHNCSTSGNTSESSLYQTLTCSDDQLKSKSLCAVVGGIQSNSSSTSNSSSSSRLSPMWAGGGEESAIPELSIRKHAWENDNKNYVMYSIHALSSSDDASASSSLSKCPAKPSMVIPCIPYSPSAGGGSAKPITEEWCRPEPGALVTSWLRQVAKEKQFSLLYLIPILISVALGVTGVAIYIRRKTFKRFELKTDGNGGTACRDNTTASTPDGTSASGPFSFLNRSSMVMVDARLSAISSSSSIESFAALSSNNVLNTLVNHPFLRLNTVAFDQIQFVNLLSEVSPSSSSSCSRNEVWLASIRGTHVAVKRISRAKNTEYEELEEFMGEITLNAALDHPNIAKFIGVAWTTLQNLCMFTEYVDNGDLQLYLKQHCLQLAWEKAKMRIAMGIASAICHLHHQQQPSVAHRDLKSKNVLLTMELDPKLINTGVGRSRLSELVTAASGSEENQVMERLYWTAPEVLQGEAHSEKSDMFAFGVLLSELDTHQLPYEGLKCMATGNDLPPLEILKKVVSGELKPATSPFCPLEIAELIDACLALDPQKRPSASEAMVVLAKVPIANVGVKTYSF